MVDHPHFMPHSDYRETFRLAEINDPTCKIVVLTDDGLEILRRALKCARKRQNWIDSEDADGYMTPDDTDWDDISSTLDDLEYRLMSACDYVTLDDVNERVGIGEDAPGTKLDVAGGLNLQTGGTFATTGKHLEIYMPSSDDIGRINAIDRDTPTPLELRFYASVYRFNEVGKVGIRKDPTYELDVAGMFQCSSNFGCNGATPRGKLPAGADATDLASVIALANQLKLALVNNGVCS